VAGPSLRTRLAIRTERLRQRSWRMAEHVSSARHVVIGGAPRSGTTLLRRIFDRHTSICAGAETKIFVPAAYSLEWLAEAYAIPLADFRTTRADALSRGELERLCAALGEPADVGGLGDVTRQAPPADGCDRPDDKGAISAAPLGRWRDELDEHERDIVERICGPRLRELGYAP
jgi:hypothetical protein